MTNDRIVAVGLLTERDLEVLGTGFTRAFPVKELSGFEDVLAQLDRIEAIPSCAKSRPRH